MRKLLPVGLAMVLAAMTLVMATEPERASAYPSHNTYGSITAPWGDAQFVAKRYGWFVRVTVTTDEYEGEASCVYARVQLDVNNGPDPKNDHVAEMCSVSGTKQQVVWLRPNLGTNLRNLKIKLCQPDWGFDSCRSGEMPVKQNRAERGDLLSRADSLMNRSLGDFIRARNNRGGPWNWNSDGCSGPALRKDTFHRACLRHDFGYRNFGWGLTVRPLDGKRAWVDDRFLQDMRTQCNNRYGGTSAGDDCRRDALINYAGVRNGAGRAFFNQG